MSTNNCISIKKRTVVDVTDLEYFCNKSWTLSFNVNTNSWISFHTYIPNWYIGENNFYYSGLNTGCDLEALAIEQVPYTTTTTTSICIGCRPPEPTTTTTTTTLSCEIIGDILELTCIIEGTAIDTTPTTTTTSSSTTSTTTTICPSCSTYKIINETAVTQVITLRSCYTDSVFTTFIPGAGVINVCSCMEPEVPANVTQELILEGECAKCFCYTITNSTGKNADFTYITCDGTNVNILLGNEESTQVCAQQSSVQSFFPLTIEGGLLPCNVDGDCVITSSRCVMLYSPSTPSSFGNNPAMERQFVYCNRFELVDFTFNGVQYATGQNITVQSTLGGVGDPIVYGVGIDGSTYVMNVSDWMNSIGVPGITFHDNLSVVDLDNSASTYTIRIDKTWADTPNTPPTTGGYPYYLTSAYGLSVNGNPTSTYGYRSCTTI